jgi:hypothetical protein
MVCLLDAKSVFVDLVIWLNSFVQQKCILDYKTTHFYNFAYALCYETPNNRSEGVDSTRKRYEKCHVDLVPFLLRGFKIDGAAIFRCSVVALLKVQLHIQRIG